MAYFLFTEAIFECRLIQLLNHGDMKREFTNNDDVVESLARVTDNVPQGNSAWSGDNPDPAAKFPRIL